MTRATAPTAMPILAPRERPLLLEDEEDFESGESVGGTRMVVVLVGSRCVVAL